MPMITLTQLEYIVDVYKRQQEDDTFLLVSGSHDHVLVAGRYAGVVCRVIGCRFGYIVGYRYA